MSNLNLAQAKRAKNDEFYTPIEAIEAEVPKYRRSLTGKIVYCNCDNPKRSQFWKYLYRNFAFLQLKELISTHYNADGVSSYALIYRGGSDSAPNCDEKVERVNLKENGDFRSDECVEFLKRSNIVITNPPFSLAKYLIKLLADYHKQFLIIGNKNLFNEIFPEIP